MSNAKIMPTGRNPYSNDYMIDEDNSFRKDEQNSIIDSSRNELVERDTFHREINENEFDTNGSKVGLIITKNVSADEDH